MALRLQQSRARISLFEHTAHNRTPRDLLVGDDALHNLKIDYDDAMQLCTPTKSLHFGISS